MFMIFCFNAINWTGFFSTSQESSYFILWIQFTMKHFIQEITYAYSSWHFLIFFLALLGSSSVYIWLQRSNWVLRSFCSIYNICLLISVSSISTEVLKTLTLKKWFILFYFISSFILFCTMFVVVKLIFIVNWCILEELGTFFLTYVPNKRRFLLDWICLAFSVHSSCLTVIPLGSWKRLCTLSRLTETCLKELKWS